MSCVLSLDGRAVSSQSEVRSTYARNKARTTHGAPGTDQKFAFMSYVSFTLDGTLSRKEARGGQQILFCLKSSTPQESPKEEVAGRKHKSLHCIGCIKS